MISDNPAQVMWMGRTYCGIRELGFTPNGHFIVSLHTTPIIDGMQGSYFTSLPISPAAFRRENPALCRQAGFHDAGSTLIVFDDWGKAHQITAARDILDTLVAECREQELPEVPVS
jgi:hypothetical protein